MTTSLRIASIASVAAVVVIAAMLLQLPAPSLLSFLQRSETIALKPTSYSLTFTVHWSLWGMSERFELEGRAPLGNTVDYASRWMDIAPKPYYAGVLVYQSEDGRFLYIGTLNQFYRMETETGDVTLTCTDELLPPLTVLGRQLSDAKNPQERDSLDPGAPTFYRWIDPKQAASAVATELPLSRYYQSTFYLGRFGLDKGEPGAGTVRFAPSVRELEPRLALDPYCG